MKSKDELGDRMKGYYENRYQFSLTRRIPVIIRIDGKSFHTFCKRFKPYSKELNETLDKVMKYLCENVQGAKMGERHSDEISILITDFDTTGTDAYFDYNVQKICSVVASLATSEFCRQLCIMANENETMQYLDIYDEKWPVFDTRCFNVPTTDVANYFYWRQLDAGRNSISMFAQAHFSSKELHGISNEDKKRMLISKKKFDWDQLPQEVKFGSMCVKEPKEIKTENGTAIRYKWTITPSLPYEQMYNLVSKVVQSI